MLLIAASASGALGGDVAAGLESVEGYRTFVPELAGLRTDALTKFTDHFSLTATIGSALRTLTSKFCGTDTLSAYMESRGVI